MEKGFTLIELIMVITLLGIIALITVPAINGTIKDSREKSYNEQEKLIVNSAKQYMADNSLYLSNVPCIVSIDTLKTNGFLSKKDIINPQTKAVMNGYVLVISQNSNYKYSYAEEESDYSECKGD